MAYGNTTDRYGSLMIGMHWLMLLLLIGVYAMINLHDFAPKGSDLRAELKHVRPMPCISHCTFSCSACPYSGGSP